MGDRSGIEWTNASWNPISGCTITSPGCSHCYAMKMAHRIVAMNPDSHYAGTTKPSNAGPVWTGKIVAAPDHILDAPLRWQSKRLIFVNSMSDLFHEDVPEKWIDRIFAVMALATQHTFQVLTKRSARMREYLNHPDRPARIMDAIVERVGPGPLYLTRGDVNSVRTLPNVWLGVSCEDQTRANERIFDLLQTPAAVRFVSAEPLLGPIDFKNIKPADRNEYDVLTGMDFDQGGVRESLDWIIVGGESGHDAREMDIEWARQIVQACQKEKVAVFVKQLGDNPVHRIGCMTVYQKFEHRKAGDPNEWPDDLRVREMPERKAA